MQSDIDLQELEQQLAPLSHDDTARRILQSTFGSVKKTGARLTILNSCLLRPPISHTEMGGLVTVERFTVLQGDIIRTDAAFVLGVRRTGNPSYMVMTSTCDAIPARRKTVLLLQVVPVLTGSAPETDIKTDLALLSKFQRTDYLYLPRIPGDAPDVLYNVVQLDELAQCENDDLNNSSVRRASLTLLGWRIFGSLWRTIQSREADQEAAIRRLAPPKIA